MCIRDSYVLSKEQRKVLCEWICGLKFPDGYASNLSRCVDQTNWWLYNLKSYDCHVFMEQRTITNCNKRTITKQCVESIDRTQLIFLRFMFEKGAYELCDPVREQYCRDTL